MVQTSFAVSLRLDSGVGQLVPSLVLQLANAHNHPSISGFAVNGELWVSCSGREPIGSQVICGDATHIVASVSAVAPKRLFCFSEPRWMLVSPSAFPLLITEPRALPHSLPFPSTFSATVLVFLCSSPSIRAATFCAPTAFKPLRLFLLNPDHPDLREGPTRRVANRPPPTSPAPPCRAAMRGYSPLVAVDRSSSTSEPTEPLCAGERSRRGRTRNAHSPLAKTDLPDPQLTTSFVPLPALVDKLQRERKQSRSGPSRCLRCPWR